MTYSAFLGLLKQPLGATIIEIWMLRSYKVATVEKDWLLDTICSHEIKPLSGRFRQEGNFLTGFFVRLYFAIDGH